MAPDREEALRDPVRDHLAAAGYDVRDEVRFNGRVADLVGVRGDRVVAVELKLRDWTTAHAQAKAYQVGAHRTVVALPHEKAVPVEAKQTRFEASGVGLWGVTFPAGDVKRLRRAREADRTLPFLAEALRDGALRRDPSPRWRRFR
jgi:hypothetical protein